MTYLWNHTEEMVALSKDILISVTGFFRDARAFESMARYLQQLFEAKQRREIFRAWVPACSTGEEAFSIAMLIADILGKYICQYRFQIFATDIDEEPVQLARNRRN